jgi:hypothetical protein
VVATSPEDRHRAATEAMAAQEVRGLPAAAAAPVVASPREHSAMEATAETVVPAA